MIKVFSTVCALVLSITLFAQQATPIEGRWDLVVEKDGKQLPSWLEVRHSGNHTLVGRFCYAFGSARPVSEVKFKDGNFSFAIPPQWEPGDKDMEFSGTLSGETLKGTMVYTDGKTYSWTGTRAPSLKRDKEPQWDKPVKLFNGKDLTGWHAQNSEKNQWIVENGILKSPKSGSNLISDKTFNDFKLHAEFKFPKGSNSGIYLRGRYEVQIEDDHGMEPEDGLAGGVYGLLRPNEMAINPADEWQTYDITLVGRLVTVVVNGKSVIVNQIIPGVTGGALDSKEGEPGPLLIQGDHGPVEFRNITITTAK